MLIFYVHFFKALVTQWDTALLPWDLLCSPGRIAWEGDIYINIYTNLLTSRPIGPVGRFNENRKLWVKYILCLQRESGHCPLDWRTTKHHIFCWEFFQRPWYMWSQGKITWKTFTCMVVLHLEGPDSNYCWHLKNQDLCVQQTQNT